MFPVWHFRTEIVVLKDISQFFSVIKCCEASDQIFKMETVLKIILRFHRLMSSFLINTE